MQSVTSRRASPRLLGPGDQTGTDTKLTRQIFASEEKLVQDLMAKRSGVCGSSSGRGLTAAVPMSGGKPWGKYRSLNSYSYWALGFFMRNLIYSRVIYSEDS